MNENWNDCASSVLDIYHELIAAVLRIWVFRSFLYIYLFFKFCGVFGGLKKVLFLWCNSGDADAIVPVTSTRYSIDALNLSTTSPYGPWYIDGQVINKQTQLRK